LRDDGGERSVFSLSSVLKDPNINKNQCFQTEHRPSRSSASATPAQKSAKKKHNLKCVFKKHILCLNTNGFTPKKMRNIFWPKIAKLNGKLNTAVRGSNLQT